jgi:hypothetical protein
MAEWRNGGIAGMEVRRKEWQNSRMAEMATYVLFTVHTHTPTTTTTTSLIFYSIDRGIHNTVADAVLRLEYDPSVNQTAESFHTTKVRNNSHQRQCWMTVSKNWCKLDIDSDI